MVPIILHYVFELLINKQLCKLIDDLLLILLYEEWRTKGWDDRWHLKDGEFNEKAFNFDEEQFNLDK